MPIHKHSHTQSWHINEDDGSIYEQSGNVINPLFIAHHDCTYETFDEWMKKANIAKAAPDLLEALKYARNIVKDKLGDDSAHLVPLDAAIKKARGE